MIKLSRSKIELFLECPRCFWLDLREKIKRPPPAPYTINNAIDYLLKQEFDAYREKGKPHPIMVKNNIDAIPLDVPEMSKWRHNFTGVQYEDMENDFLLYGAVDDVWVNPAGELIVVDYKATGAKEHKIYDSYRRQMEVYQWLLAQLGHKVSPRGYFVFAKVNKAEGFEKASLSFDLIVEPCVGDNAWIPKAVRNARLTFDFDIPPVAAIDCEYCAYSEQAGRFVPESA